MQFKVPQDVQQADKIVGPLTLAQLIMSVIGFAIAYAIYTVLSRQGLPFIIWLPPVGFIAVLTVAFAFIKIANLPFYRYLALVIERFASPSKRVWVKGADNVSSDLAEVAKEKKKTDKDKKESDALAEKEKSLSNIKGITANLDILSESGKEDKEKEVEEIEEINDNDLLQKSFLEEGETKKEATPEKAPKEKSAEDKILAMSGTPQLEKVAPTQTETKEDDIKKASEKPTKQADITSETAPEKPKKKRRRRRRKKKKPILENTSASIETKEKIGEIKSEESNKKAINKETKKEPQTSQEFSTDRKPVEGQEPQEPQESQESQVSQSKNEEPAAPSWLDEKPSTDTAKETIVETKSEEPNKKVINKEIKKEPQTSQEFSTDPKPVEGQEPHESQESQESQVSQSKNEEVVAETTAEPVPAADKPVEMKQDTRPAPSAVEENQQPVPTTAKASESFSADELKQGQTVQFPQTEEAKQEEEEKLVKTQ